MSHPMKAMSTPDDDSEQLTGISSFTGKDVLLGRGGAIQNHVGNRTFRELVFLNKGLYATCVKTDKPKIAKSIVAAIREAGGRFLERDKSTGLWNDFGDDRAAEKTSQALREGQASLRKMINEVKTVTAGTSNISASAPQLATTHIQQPPNTIRRNATHSSAPPAAVLSQANKSPLENIQKANMGNDSLTPSTIPALAPLTQAASTEHALKSIFYPPQTKDNANYGTESGAVKHVAWTDSPSEIPAPVTKPTNESTAKARDSVSVDSWEASLEALSLDHVGDEEGEMEDGNDAVSHRHKRRGSLDSRQSSILSSFTLMQQMIDFNGFVIHPVSKPRISEISDFSEIGCPTACDDLNCEGADGNDIPCCMILDALMKNAGTGEPRSHEEGELDDVMNYWDSNDASMLSEQQQQQQQQQHSGPLLRKRAIRRRSSIGSEFAIRESASSLLSTYSKISDDNSLMSIAASLNVALPPDTEMQDFSVNAPENHNVRTPSRKSFMLNEAHIIDVPRLPSESHRPVSVASKFSHLSGSVTMSIRSNISEMSALDEWSGSLTH